MKRFLLLSLAALAMIICVCSVAGAGKGGMQQLELSPFLPPGTSDYGVAFQGIVMPVFYGRIVAGPDDSETCRGLIETELELWFRCGSNGFEERFFPLTCMSIGACKFRCLIPIIDQYSGRFFVPATGNDPDDYPKICTEEVFYASPKLGAQKGPYLNTDMLVRPDSDTDGVPDAFDNCPSRHNWMQEDEDLNGIGDVCEPPQLDPNAATIPNPSGIRPEIAPKRGGVTPEFKEKPLQQGPPPPQPGLDR